MNYQKVYNNLIEKGKVQTLPQGTYIEKHHIVPRSLGGSNEATNIVRLTARQHYIAHKLLVFIYKKIANEGKDKTPYYKMLRAFTAMIYLWGDTRTSNKRRLNTCSRMYESWKNDLREYRKTHDTRWIQRLTPEEKQTYRKKMSEALKKHFESHPGTFFGKHHSEEAKKKISQAHKNKGFGEKNSQYGKHWWMNPLTKECRSFHDNDNIPNGWIRGRTGNFGRKDYQDRKLVNSYH